MDLVIKISDKCNFACDFCSSHMIATNHKELHLWKVQSFIAEHPEVRNIIVNGGDPLCVDIEWYYNLLYWIDENKLDINVSFTTNLWDFYKNPDKWTELFKSISVCTSFQYGSERKLATGEVFTENMFRDIFKLFEEKVGYKLKFIAVQNFNNAAYDLKTVKLAKELGTTCRINPALRSGRTVKPYPFHLMMLSWLKIIENGYGKYEDNCKLIMDAYNDYVTECPFNSHCHDSIRCMSPNGEVHACPAIADDILKGVDDAYCVTEDKRKAQPFVDLVLQPKCYQCRLFNLCNSCTKRIMDIHEMGDRWLEKHCQVMQEYVLPKLEKLSNEHV